MSTYADDIRRIAEKTQKNKGGLGDAEARESIGSSTFSTSDLVPEDELSVQLTPPLTLDVLTYDDTKDVEITDTSSNTHTLKTAATAKITDANGYELEINTINFATPP
jgi:hypothetical protein